MNELAGIYHYHRCGFDERALELRADGSIGQGGGEAERRWQVRSIQGTTRLSIFGRQGETCRLACDPDGAWRGRWLMFERMPVELVPQRLQPLRSLENRGGRYYAPHKFHFISYAQLVRDCTQLARSLPPVRAVVGVPRSGMIPASLIAMELNAPMLSIETLFQEEEPQILVSRRGFGNRVREGIILVVDDTSASGRQMDHLRTLVRVSVPVKYAAIYVEDRPILCVDYHHSKLPDVPQFYEWTMFHDHQNSVLLTDLDGVLCEDWTGGDEQQDEWGYLHFLQNAVPRRIPSVPLKGIVTNRLERHRPQTEAWLARHGIQYRTLHMSPHPTFATRNLANDSAIRKADLYAADPSLWLFVESDDVQAVEIARRTGRPVFSMARNGPV